MKRISEDNIPDDDQSTTAESFVLVNNEEISECTEGIQDLSLLEKQKISVFIKLIGQHGIDSFFEISELTQSDSIAKLKGRVLKMLRAEGFISYVLSDILDLTTNEMMVDDDYLSDKHVYQMLLNEGQPKSDSKLVFLTLIVNNDYDSLKLNVLTGKSIAEIVLENVEGIEKFLSTRKMCTSMDRFVPCEKSTMIREEGEKYWVDVLIKGQNTEPNASTTRFISDFNQAQQDQLNAVRNVRSFLSKKEVPLEEAINEVIQSGVLNFMVECLKSSSVEIQKEASWVLINVSAGSDEHADAVIDIGAIDHLVNLIDSVDIGVIENAIWALYNLAHDNFNVCKRLMHLQVDYLLLVLVDQYFSELNRSLLSMIVEFVNRIFTTTKCNCNECVLENLVKCILKITNFDDNELKISALKSLIYVTSKSKNGLNMVSILASPKLTTFLNSDDLEVQKQTLKLAGNILAGSCANAECVLIYPVMKCFSDLVSVEELRALVIRCISNLAAGDEKQIVRLVKSGLLGYIVKYLDCNDDQETQNEVIWTFVNLIDSIPKSRHNLLLILNTEVLQSIASKIRRNTISDNKARERLLDALKYFRNHLCNHRLGGSLNLSNC